MGRAQGQGQAAGAATLRAASPPAPGAVSALLRGLSDAGEELQEMLSSGEPAVGRLLDLLYREGGLIEQVNYLHPGDERLAARFERHLAARQTIDRAVQALDRSQPVNEREIEELCAFYAPPAPAPLAPEIAALFESESSPQADEDLPF